MAILCLWNTITGAQNLEIVPYQIGERMPDLPLKNIINYKDSTGSLSQFGNKLLILDFWNVHCGTCIGMFPKEDSLQAIFSDDVQFLLVTSDSKEKVMALLEKYNSAHKKPLSLPIIFGDELFSKLFRFSYLPHYVWVAPNGRIMGQTSHEFITKENLANTLLPIRKEEQRLKGNKYADINLKMPKPSQAMLRVLSIINQ